MRMPRKWNEQDLVKAVASNTSIRGTLKSINLRPTGGNYNVIKIKILELKLDTAHFKGKAWNKGLVGTTRSNRIATQDLLQKNSHFQSFKLKKRLFQEGIKFPKCELCGWSEISQDGRIPVELDHINGDNTDNRIENLRILCPNCHSLQPTHRGRNIGHKHGRVAELVYAFDLKSNSHKD